MTILKSTHAQNLKRAFSIMAVLFAQSISLQSFASVIYDGVTFPEGDISFADMVVSYDPVSNNNGYPTDAHKDATAALGTPDYTSNVTFCTNLPSCPYVSLGWGGSITLKFVNNLLTGSNSSAPDLWIFEIGSDVEDTFVEISQNGLDWFDVGKVFGDTSGVDIDAFGFTATDFFQYVRLTDDPNEGEGAFGGITTGADIDAVGAISTVFNPDPDIPLNAPATVFLTALSCAFLVVRVRNH